MRRVLPLLTGIALAWAAELHLNGEDNAIRFGSDARLSASCGTPSPDWVFGFRSDDLFTAILRNVKLGCLDATVNEPCAPSDAYTAFPPMWSCRFTSEGQAFNSSQVAPKIVEHKAGSSVIGLQVSLACPIPRVAMTAGVNAASILSGTDSVEALVEIMSPAGPLPFAGPAGGDMLTVSAISPPPPSAPPPAIPPSLPPFAPPPPTRTGVTSELAFNSVADGDGLPDGLYYIRVAPDATAQLQFDHYGGKAWARVYQKVGTTTSVFTVSAKNSPTASFADNYKLSDEQMNYLTSTDSAWGACIVPNYEEVYNGVWVDSRGAEYVNCNLLRSNDGSRAYPVGSSIIADGGDMAKSNLLAPSLNDYPSEERWLTTLFDNNYCGGTQVWAADGVAFAKALLFRLIANDGCSYHHFSNIAGEGSCEAGGNVEDQLNGGITCDASPDVTAILVR